MVFQTPIPEDSYVREVAGDIDIVRGRKGEGGDSKFPGAGERILLPVEVEHLVQGPRFCCL